MEKNGSIKGLIYKCLGFACILLCIMNVIERKPFWGTICCVAAICFINGGKVKDSEEVIRTQTQKFLANKPGAKELVDEVLACPKVDAILISREFHSRGVKLVSIDPTDKVNFVLTRDCLYDGVYSGYREPSVGVLDVRFQKGEEFKGTQRVHMDEDRMAAQGLLVGGLGVAAMNVASAREANAQGGAVVGVRTGKNRFMLSVRKDVAHVWVMIIRKDLVGNNENPFGECYVREGKYYNAYYCQILPTAQCQNAANEMTKLLQKAVQTTN